MKKKDPFRVQLVEDEILEGYTEIRITLYQDGYKYGSRGFVLTNDMDMLFELEVKRIKQQIREMLNGNSPEKEKQK
jgi:hypothetical protein